jgi:hypothetical protein
MRGIMFLGTPHHGARLAKVVLRATIGAPPFVNQLEPACEEIENIFAEFNTLAISRRCASFYESYTTLPLNAVVCFVIRLC